MALQHGVVDANAQQELLCCLSEAQEELQSLQAELVACRQQNDALQRQLADAADGAGTQPAALQEQLADATRARAQLQQAVHQMQAQQLQQDEQHRAAHEALSAHAAAATRQAAAARAEHKQLQATADAQLAELSTLLRAAQSGERAALADASQARAALAGSRRELGEALEQLQQAKEQLLAMGGLRGQLAELQAALAQRLCLQQQQQPHAAAPACADDGSADKQQLQEELQSCKLMLAEAQEDVARLEVDSRDLAGLMRATRQAGGQSSAGCSRIPAAPAPWGPCGSNSNSSSPARPSTAAGHGGCAAAGHTSARMGMPARPATACAERRRSCAEHSPPGQACQPCAAVRSACASTAGANLVVHGAGLGNQQPHRQQAPDAGGRPQHSRCAQLLILPHAAPHAGGLAGGGSSIMDACSPHASTPARSKHKPGAPLSSPGAMHSNHADATTGSSPSDRGPAGQRRHSLTSCGARDKPPAGAPTQTPEQCMRRGASFSSRVRVNLAGTGISPL